jgi:hypothetical protein
MPSRLSANARRFLAEHIHSVMQLELLLLVAARGAEGVGVQEAGGELRAPIGWVETQLVDLGGQRVLEFDARDGGRYRLAPGARHAAVIGELDEAYRRRRTSVIRAIFAPPPRDLESFSDAFRLRDAEEEEED